MNRPSHSPDAQKGAPEGRQEIVSLLKGTKPIDCNSLKSDQVIVVETESGSHYEITVLDGRVPEVLIQGNGTLDRFKGMILNETIKPGEPIRLKHLNGQNAHTGMVRT